MLPRVLRCDLTPADWNLLDQSDAGTAAQLNTALSAAVNQSRSRDEVTHKMAIEISKYHVTPDERQGVLMVIERLLRAIFE